ncbi:MAG: cupin domain-containing protein [Thermoanaerobaculia bacterium]
MRVTIEQLDVRGDARGISFDPVPPGELGSWGAMHAVVTMPGCVRGNHLHADADELLVIAGPAFARFRDGGSIDDFEIAEGEVVRFRIPRGISHAVLARGLAPQFMVSLYSVESPKTGRDVLIEASQSSNSLFL